MNCNKRLRRHRPGDEPNIFADVYTKRTPRPCLRRPLRTAGKGGCFLWEAAPFCVAEKLARGASSGESISPVPEARVGKRTRLPDPPPASQDAEGSNVGCAPLNLAMRKRSSYMARYLLSAGFDREAFHAFGQFRASRGRFGIPDSLPAWSCAMSAPGPADTGRRLHSTCISVFTASQSASPVQSGCMISSRKSSMACFSTRDT